MCWNAFLVTTLFLKPTRTPDSIDEAGEFVARLLIYMMFDDKYGCCWYAARSFGFISGRIDRASVGCRLLPRRIVLQSDQHAVQLLVRNASFIC